jgi:hypothetical protein
LQGHEETDKGQHEYKLHLECNKQKQLFPSPKTGVMELVFGSLQGSRAKTNIK